MYPLQATNDSTIILCGHEQGLLILWKRGCHSENADLREAEQCELVSEEEAPECSYSKLCNPTVHSLELPFGAAVLHLSFPVFSSELHHSSTRSLPSLLSNKLVVAVACSDSKIWLLTLALSPPLAQNNAESELHGNNPLRKNGIDHFGVQTVLMSGHTGIPRGVSITLSPRYSHMIDPDETDEDTKISDPPSRTNFQTLHGDLPDRSIHHIWDFLVASHSADLSGLLLIHRVAILANGCDIDVSFTENLVPWQTHRLSSPASHIYFNPSLHPAPQHSEILVVGCQGVLRVLKCLPLYESQLEGSWLISLYTAFEATMDCLDRRKSILDAQWCLNGKGIIVLHTDGEWGIWDLQNIRVKAPIGHNSAQSVLGTTSAFVLGGWIHPLLSSRHPSKTSMNKREHNSKLAPMTPGTRKIRQDILFACQMSQPRNFISGGISVTPISNGLNDGTQDESLVLWHGDNTVILPSIYTCWLAHKKASRNLLNAETDEQLRQSGIAHLKGETQSEVTLIPEFFLLGCTHGRATRRALLVAGEHRIAIVSFSYGDPNEEAISHVSSTVSSTDLHSLAAGDLTIKGINRMLTEMSKSIQTCDDFHPKKVFSLKKVGVLKS